MTDQFPRFDAARAKILERALDHAAFDGWSRGVLEAAAREAELPEGAAELYFPRGPVDAIDFWHLQADQAMAAALAQRDVASMRIRDRIAAAVMARLEPMRRHREAARRAGGRLMLPDGVAAKARILWRASDAMWRAAGDTSTDANWYSKRATLAGVYASTFSVFLDDRDPDLTATRAFLDRRIGDVMTFEKVKAQARSLRAGLPDPVGVMTRLRYGRTRRRPGSLARPR